MHERCIDLVPSSLFLTIHYNIYTIYLPAHYVHPTRIYIRYMYISIINSAGHPSNLDEQVVCSLAHAC